MLGLESSCEEMPSIMERWRAVVFQLLNGMSQLQVSKMSVAGPAKLRAPISLYLLLGLTEHRREPTFPLSCFGNIKSNRLSRCRHTSIVQVLVK